MSIFLETIDFIIRIYRKRTTARSSRLFSVAGAPSFCLFGKIWALDLNELYAGSIPIFKLTQSPILVASQAAISCLLNLPQTQTSCLKRKGETEVSAGRVRVWVSQKNRFKQNLCLWVKSKSGRLESHSGLHPLTAALTQANSHWALADHDEGS